MTITVYSKPQCVQCDYTYKVLDTKEATYTSHNITEDAAALEQVKELGYLAAPVVTVRDSESGQIVEHWSGFRPDLISKYV